MKLPSQFISIPSNPDLSLRLIDETHIESLRIWKNKSASSFFNTSTISRQQQTRWYSNYTNSSFNFMFVCKHTSVCFGCMGIRLIDKIWDVYNVILGLDDYGSRGYMSLCLHEMISSVLQLHNAPVQLSVLSANPAVRWYQKNNFRQISSHSNYIKMQYIPIVSDSLL